MNKFFTRFLMLVAFVMFAVTVSAQPRMRKAEKSPVKTERVKFNKRPSLKKALGGIKTESNGDIEEININSKELKIVDYTRCYGLFEYYAVDEETDDFVDILVYTEECDGIFSEGDIDSDYSYFICDKDTFYYVSGDIEVATDENGNSALKGSVLCEDDEGKQMTFNLNCETIEVVPTSEMNFESDITMSGSYYSDYGYYSIEAELDELSSLIFSSADDSFVGKFTERNLDVFYTYLMLESETDFGFYDVLKANYEISETENEGEYKFEGSFILRNEDDPTDCPKCNVSFKFRFTLQYDVEDRDFSASFSGDDLSFDDSYADEYDYYYIEGKNEEGKYILLELVLSQSDPETFVPVGEYPVDASYDSMDVVSASTGVDDEDGYIYGTYVAELDENGDIADDGLWMITEGNMTVTRDEESVKIVLVGNNSYGRDVNVTISYPLFEEKEKGEGIVNNPGFENWTSDDSPKGWTGWQINEKSNTGSATLQKTDDCYEGEYACLVKGASSNKRLATEKMFLDAGTYIVEFYAKSVGESCVIKPGYAKQNGENVSYNYGEYSDEGITLKSTWQKISYEFTLEEDSYVSMIVMNYKNSGDFIIDSYNVYGTYADAIASVKSESKAAKALFNLQGMRVGNDYKGMVISNGKKYIKK